MRLKGRLNVAALERTFGEVVRRHEVLRTSFSTASGYPQQIISPPRTVSLPVIDLGQLAVADRESAARRLAEEAAAQPFDLSTGPLLRISLLRFDEDDYVLLITMHHIVSDAWSMGVLTKEIATLYHAFSRQLPSPLPELAVQYADYAVWQREWLQGEVLEQQLAYWRGHLGGELPVLKLPTDRPYPVIQSSRGAHYLFKLPSEFTAPLREISRQAGTTLFMTLLAAFKTLLYRYTNQEDILIVTPIAGRNRQETEPLIGFFVNTLALRTDLSGQPSFRELLRRVREVCLGAYAHQDVPFEKLVEELQPERSLSRSPLSQVMFGMQNAPGEQLQMSGVQVSGIGAENATTKVDLSLLISEQGEDLRAAMEYSTDLFEAGTIERLTRHLRVLLEAIVEQPDRSIGELALLEEAERAQIIYEWNETAQDYPTESCVHELFEQQAERTPDAIAVVCGAEQLSYAKLNARANQLAHYLREQGVGAEVRVGLCLERSIEMVVALLGILKAGGAYVPLDPQYPAQRLSFMMEDAELQVLVTEERTLNQLPVHWGSTVVLDAERDAIAECSTANLERTAASATAANLVYIIYTSGSTGTPKGTMITHRSLCNLTAAQNYAFGLRPDARLLQFASISFDASVWEFFMALCSGAQLHLPAADIVLAGSALFEVLRDSHISVVTLPPSVLAQVETSEQLDKLETLIVAGEACGPEVVQRWSAGRRFYNAYGPTEVCVCASIWEATAASSERVLIGRPMSNTQLYILDERMEAVGVGVRGELYIGGAGVARGYLHRPELTAERFVPHPFSRQEGARLYRTGDVARYLEDGSIEYVGRADTQVKVRGYRIELGEIEAVVSEHPLVQQCVVIVREETAGDQRIVAYVVWAGQDSEAKAETEELKGYVRERVPAYMVPQNWVVLEQLPLSANGKVDRKALPAPTAQGTTETEAATELTPIEEMMEGIWREVLHVERVGVEENFFERGGHSLLATQVVSRIREVFGVEVALRSLFEEGTLGALSRRVEATLREEASTLAPPLVPVSRDRELPLSFAQQRLWFLQQLEPESSSYNVPAAVRLSGSLNIRALEQTLSEVVRRHEALRTRFLTVGGQPQQVISPPQPIELPITDLSHLDTAERETKTREMAGAAAAQPFDLSMSPLLRVQLLRLDEEEHILLFTAHHIISDGWSMGVLIKEVATLYEAFSHNLPSPLPELAVQYADYAVWQREWLQGEVLEEQLAYWRNQLGGELSVLELPTDKARPAVQSYRGAGLGFRLPAEVTQQLKEVTRREGATLFMTLLAAFQTLLSRYSGQQNIIVGSPIAGRNRQETEPLIGFFINTLALRTDLGAQPSFRELLRRVREVCLGAYAHQDVPFEKLVEELQPERDLSRSPLFQVMFSLQNAPGEQLRMSGVQVGSVGGEVTTAKFDLSLLMGEQGEELGGSLVYNTDLFEAGTIERLTRHLRVLLEAIVAQPERSIGELTLLEEAERAQIIYEWNETAQEYPAESCIHELFEQQVERTPDAVAVVCERQEISYRELNLRANQLAHYLREQGVGAEVGVGVCLERSIEMVVALLGILKAGGAYVPLDPTYPTQRLAFMLEDTKVLALLTQDSIVGKIPPGQTRMICLDAEKESIARQSPLNVGADLRVENLAYVIYTSGSTGIPKGVAISHRSAVAFLHWVRKTFSVEELSGVLASTSICFDLSIFELFGTLSVGGKIILAENILHLPAIPAIDQVTLINTVPSAITELAKTGEFPCKLRLVNLAGEPIPKRLIEQLYAGGTVEHVFNLYGPSEDTTYSTYALMSKDGTNYSHIGRPISNTQIFILDNYYDCVPIGVSGELYIAGTGLARGYLRRPELTAERFLPNPFSAEAGARFYRTGDVARYLKDGSIEYVGRADTQVKVRGYRIELGEIEAVVSERPRVQQCVVTVRQESEGDKRLVCYLVWVAPHSEAEVRAEIEEIKRHVRERVPAYMVPQSWVVLDQLPLSANGKVDRRALPAPTAQGAAEPETELTPVEEMMEGIWQEVLHVERVGVEENFFERGGHSLLATQVISRVRERFQIDLPLRSVFEEGTLGRLSRRVEAALREQTSTLAPPLMPVSRDRELPLSFAQQRLWFLYQLEPDSGFYNMFKALRLTGDLHLPALEQTLYEVVRRHEALRTCFQTVGGQPQQIISPPQPIELPITDLSGLPVTERKAVAQELAGAAAAQPFDLSMSPLLRVQLLRLVEEEHILLFTAHHIISDGWSMGVLIKEVATLYEAFSHNLPSPLPELAVQYADYAVWQREWLQGEMLEEQLAYWRNQLGGELSVLELPTDKARPAVQSYRGARLSFRLPAELTRQLRQLSQREGATLFMTLLAAFQTLLSRYSGQQNIIVGSPIAGRNRQETEPLIGFFINTLALRTDLGGQPSFRELLRRVREVCLGAYAHQDVPFEKLVEELQPERDLSRSPLFQVMFSLQNAPGEQLRMSGVQVGSVGGEVTTAKFDLSLLMGEQGEELGGSLVYNTDLFEAGTIERLTRHLIVLLEAIVSQPERSIGELALLEEAERAQIIYEWNETAQEYPAESCIHELFEQQVERTPDAVAVVCGEEQLSYAELNARANQLAHYLRERAVGAEVRVGLCLERSIEMVVALLGILKAGGAYVPLDPQYPAQRLAFMLSDAGVEVLITQERVRRQQVLPVEQPQFMLCLDSADGVVARQRTTNPERTPTSATAANLAYVIYTSGSTGIPKGVGVRHQSLSNYAQFIRRELRTGEAKDEALQFATVSTLAADLGNTAIFPSLTSGGCLHVIDYEVATDGDAFARYISQHRVDVLKIVPSHLNSLLGARKPTDILPRRYLILGGEALSFELVKRVREASPDCKIINHYGPTETTVGAVIYRIEAAGETYRPASTTVPIGRPIANTEIYILDRNYNPVPVRVPGELYISGEGLARGYLHRPALTAERFVPHPFSQRGGERLYRTGDVARYLKDGSIEYVGRADTQVKVRGYRIELGEIEAVVSGHPAVRQCVVSVREEVAGDQRIVAYVVWAEQDSDEKGGAETEELKEYVREHVPAYMVPQNWVVLDQLPLSANGKVDRRALPAPTAQGATETERELTQVEELMEGIWCEVLHVERVGVEENFFERGGHSLLATQVISRVRERFQIDLPLRSLFEEGTLGGLSRRVEAALREEATTLAPPLVAVSRDRELPLSFAQQRLWFLQQLEPESAFYNSLRAVRLSGSLNIRALERTLSEVVRRHEALRTRFLTVGGRPQQIITAPHPVELPIIDLTLLSVAEREAAARKLAGEAAAQTFDLAAGSLLRGQLLRLGAEEHVLLCSMHHIVSDAWSMGVLVREVVALYEAFGRELPSPLPELAVQYADYAVWQREWLQGEVLEEQLAYWRDQLGGELPVLNLPTDYPRPPRPSYRGARLSFHLPGELTQQLRQLSQREGTTLFMTLLAAFQTLLSRYTGQQDIIVGSPIAGRNRQETESLIGLFLNTLALHADLSGDPPFRELLCHVREVCLGAYAHQDVPFEKLVEELQPERDMSRSPLFQALFTFQSARNAENLQLRDVSLTKFNSETATAKFELSLSAIESSAGMLINAEYSTDLFNHSTIERMLRHFGVLLEGITENSNKRIGDLALLAEEEWEQIVYGWNETQREYPAESCIHELFEQQVERTPEAVAAVFKGQEFSYRELNARANQLAHYLQKQGVGEETLVGLCVDRSVEMVIGLLAILKSGGAYVPLDPMYPVQRLSFMIEDAQLKVLLTQQRLVEGLSLDDSSCICLDSDWHRISRESEENSAAGTVATNLAYVIYTSGSTGLPKGTQLSHRSVVNLLHSMMHQPGITGQDTLLAVTTLSFDIAALELFLPLIAGARLVIASREMASDAVQLKAYLTDENITFMQATPATWNMLIEAGWTGDPALTVLCGGEALSQHLADELLKRSRRLWNVYGPTETTIWSTTTEVTEDTPVSIGRPIANTQTYVLDKQLRPVPIGVIGELYIGGAGLARGYYHRPDITAAAFIPHPFDRNPSARLYKTGDLVRYAIDGTIKYIGRADTQVKVRGHRIELGEIEAVVGGHAAVQQCVVTLREEAEGDQRLICYVVWTELVSVAEEATEIEKLREYLHQRVPAYMMPQNWVVLEQFPLSANGKVDRRALPAPAAQGAAETGTELTPVEEIMEGIWREVLHVERVGVEENFFERGGHSLLATQVVSRIREVFGVEVALRSLFEEGTLGALSRRVEALLRQERAVAAPPLERVSRERELPLSFAQQRLWFLQQLEPDSAFYNSHRAVRLNGVLNVTALEQTLSEVVRRHEALRTCFLTAGGQPQQVISPPKPIELPLADLSGLPVTEREAAARELASAAAAQPFDLSTSPLLRVQLLRLAEADHALLFTVHHIVSDGWSMGVLIKEVATLYEAFSRQLPSPLPELPVQYADYAVWQREWLQGEVLEEQLSYWRDQLGGELPVLELPTDRTRPAVQSYRGAKLGLHLPTELTQQLKKITRREGATLFMALLAAIQTLLSRYSGQQDIIIGTDIANRNRKETEPLIGFFVNQLVLRTDLGGQPSFRELLRRVREVCLGAYAHQDVPFEKLVEELQPERDASRSPLFQVKLVLQNAPRERLELGDLRLGQMGVEVATARYDLALLMVEQGEQLGGSLVYNTDLFETGTIERLTRHLAVLLKAIVEQPDRSVDELGLLEEAERAQIIYEWNETEQEYPAESCIHELFEQQVERTPDAVAVVSGVEQLSYAELNARANQLAHYLREQGVGAEVRVGLCLERSIDMIVTLLGILKAGGAYVPLDPTYPTHRLAFMMEDAELQMLVTEERMLDHLPVHWGSTVVVDAERDAIAEHSIANPEQASNSATAANLAYVIYTSGSTGTPKGVAITHASLLNYLCWASRYYPFTGAISVPLHSSLSFDLTVTSLFCPLLLGRFVHLLAPAAEAETLSQLWTQGGGYSVVKVTPAHLAVINPEATPERMRQWTKALVVGGEALRWEQVREWVRAGVRVYNEYGPTETVVGSCVYEVRGAEGEEERGHGGVLIGRPVSNTQLYILDERMEAVGVGIRGELYIGGAGVARGYLHRPELTAERFVPHPYSQSEGARLYQTGDVARYLEDGSIEYVGRADTQVKVRGYRIELGEIEAVVSEHPAVQQCVVAVREEAAGDQRIVAYVVWAEQGSEGKPGAEIEELKGYVRERVPMYMVPQNWVALEQLPLSANGKVDHRALPAPSAQGATETKAETELTPIEEMMEGIWLEVLQVERVGVEENFFERGGHSLLGTQVVSRIREVFGVEVALRSLFEEGTLGALSRRVEVMLREQASTLAPPLVPVSRDRELPLSFAQQRLWFLQQLEPESAFYNSHRAVRFSGRLDITALKETLNEVVRRHEALRTRFLTVGGQPQQVILPPQPIELPITDLSHLDDAEREARARELAGAAAAQPFDLSRGPLLRVQLLRLDEEEHVVLMTMHHIVSDGWSMGVLIKEVATLYEAFSHELPSPLPELPVQYADYAVWQREWLQGAVLEEQLAYWRNQLGGELPVLELPTDRVRPAVQSYRGARVRFRLSTELTQQLKQLSQREGATLFMTLLAAFQTLLSRYSGQQDIIVGTDIANRNRRETEPLIGFFVNQLVLRTDLSGEPGFVELLGRVRSVCLGAYAHQDVPFEKLVEELQPERDASRSPLFQAVFVLDNAPGASVKLPGLGLKGVSYESSVVRFDLTLWMAHGPEGLVGSWAYKTDLFDDATIKRMRGHFQTLLESIAANPEARLSTLNILTEEEKQLQAMMKKERDELNIKKLRALKRRSGD